jgi:hypothetical protein
MSDHPQHPHRSTGSSDRRTRAEDVFTPASPVTRRDLFAGRTQALQQLLDLIEQPGRHAVVFGERGIGKTSLATIVPEMFSGSLGVVRVEVAEGDTFASIWRRVSDTVRATLLRAERGLATSPFTNDATAALPREGDVTESAVLALLSRLSAAAPAWVVIDDLDRLTDADARARMRAVAEASGAPAPGVTLVFAGTAVAGGALLDPSTALVPVHAGRMGADETMECVLRALRVAGLTAEDGVIERIALLANGLPHVPHALALAAARRAGEERVAHLTDAHLDAAVTKVIAGAEEEVETAYEQSIVRARRGIYPEILLACAAAPRDAFGRFDIAGVCEAVTRIVRREVRGLTNQVNALTEEGRGAVLIKTGAARTARYRFSDPRLEPYILMRGLEAGWTTHTEQAPATGTVPLPRAA